MKPKLLIGILFLVIFSTSFLVYLFVVNFISPHFDLSTTAKQQLEIAPDLNDSSASRNDDLNNIKELQEKAMKDLEMEESKPSSDPEDDSYVPMDELTGGRSGENRSGVLDGDDISNVSAPGEERRVAPVSSHN